MSTTCQTYVPVVQNEDPCNGEQYSTNCVIHQAAIVYLSLPANSTLTVVLQNYLASLVDARARIAVLETQNEDFEARITALENA